MLEQDHIAAAFATSTALSTEMPTSAACSAGASLMPSPRKPTDVAAPLEGEQDALLLLRRHAAEQVDRRQARPRALVAQVRVISSPVSTPLTGTAELVADMLGDALVVAGQDLDVDARGRERRDGRSPHRPWAGPERRRSRQTSARSRRHGGGALVPAVHGAVATQERGIPPLRAARTLRRWRRSALVRSDAPRLRLIVGGRERKMSSGAPLTTSTRAAPSLIRTDTRRRSKSKGTSSTLRHCPYRATCCAPGWRRRAGS